MDGAYLNFKQYKQSFAAYVAQIENDHPERSRDWHDSFVVTLGDFQKSLDARGIKKDAYKLLLLSAVTKKRIRELSNGSRRDLGDILISLAEGVMANAAVRDKIAKVLLGASSHNTRIWPLIGPHLKPRQKVHIQMALEAAEKMVDEFSPVLAANVPVVNSVPDGGLKMVSTKSI